MKRLWSLHRRQIKGIAGVSALFLGLQALYINASPVNPGNSVAAHQKKFAQGHILVQPKAGLSDDNFNRILNKHGASKKSKIDKINVHLINVAPGQEESAVAELAQDPNIKFAELDQVIEADMTSNDPYLSSQWHIAKINAPNAWDYTVGTGITIAILDSGIDSTHPDLAPNLIPGYNVYDNNSDTTEICGHGTKVAGSAAAVNNNGLGVAGVAGQAKILPVRITDTTCYAYFSSTAAGITYAADHGARVVNVSYGYTQLSTAAQSAGQYLRSKGGLLFVSAGNNAIDEGFAPTDNSMISVSSTDSTDALSSFSSWGNFVVLAAPGSGIYTTVAGGGYGSVSGTSFSSPIAAATAALVMAANPSLTADQVQNILTTTAVDLGTAGRDNKFGYGRVDAAAAVLAASKVVISDNQAPSTSFSGVSSGSVVKGLASINVNASDNIAVSRVELYAGGVLVGSDNMAPYSFSWDTAQLPDGNVTLTAKAYDAAGNVGSSSATVSVRNTVDSTAPVVSISNPLASAVLKGTSASIQASASDNVGVASMTLSIDGAAKASSSSGSISYNLNVKKLSSGAHTIRVDAKDASGNVGTQTIQVSK